MGESRVTIHAPRTALPGSLAIPPELAAMRARWEALRTELAILLTERDDLEERILPNLEAEYAVKLGDLELARLRLDVETRRLRRVLELSQARLNQGQLPDLRQIERQVEAELDEWTRQIEEKQTGLRSARLRMASLVTLKVAAEVRSLFRLLARKLHPDLNPGLGTSESALWRRAKDAYARGDAEELRALAALVDQAPAVSDGELARDEWKRRCDELEARVAVEIARTDEWKRSRGFERLSRVRDPIWVAERRAALESEIARADVWRDALASQVALLREGGDDQRPRPN